MSGLPAPSRAVSTTNRSRRWARRVLLLFAFATLSYPVSYLLLRATNVLVHQKELLREMDGEGFLKVESKLPPPLLAEGLFLYEYEWHQVGRGSLHDPPRWGEKLLPKLYSLLSELELRTRGYDRVAVEVRWLQRVTADPGSGLSWPGDLIATEEFSRSEVRDLLRSRAMSPSPSRSHSFSN